MDRKEFLKVSCDTCLMGAAAIILSGIAGCGPGYPVFKTAVIDNAIEVPLPVFEKSSLQLVRPKGWQYDIGVQKNTDGSFTALLLQCTHMENQLAAAQNGYTCSLHGSRFSREGKVLKGPAENALKKFKTTINNNNLIISI